MDSLNSYYQGRYFYMEINSYLGMGELLYTFFRRFKDVIPSSMTFCDFAGNEVDVVIDKCHRTDKFLVVDVKDHYMRSKELCSPPLKLTVEVRPSVPIEEVINISDDICNESPVVDPVEFVTIPEILHQQDNSTPFNPNSADTINEHHILPQSVVDTLTCVDPTVYAGLEPYSGKVIFSPNKHVQQEQCDPIPQLLSFSGVPSSPSLTFPPTGTVSAPLEQTIHHSNTSPDVVTNHNIVSPNSRSPTPPPPHNSHVVLPSHFPLRLEYYSVVRMISKYQSTHYSMLLPSAFSSQAFPSRLDFVRVRELRNPPIVMKLRWWSLKSSEAFLTRGWRRFSIDHGLKCGSVVRFLVPTNDETTIFVSILRL
ncbi:hypothetical protein HN51_060072 [Arachis hypogaea]